MSFDKDCCMKVLYEEGFNDVKMDYVYIMQ